MVGFSTCEDDTAEEGLDADFISLAANLGQGSAGAPAAAGAPVQDATTVLNVATAVLFLMASAWL